MTQVKDIGQSPAIRRSFGLEVRLATVRGAAHGKRRGPRQLPIRFSVQPGPAGVVTLKGRTLSPVARRFIDCAREVCGSLAKQV